MSVNIAASKRPTPFREKTRPFLFKIKDVQQTDPLYLCNENPRQLHNINVDAMLPLKDKLHKNIISTYPAHL